MGRVFFILITLSLILALLTNRAPSAASALLTSAESGVSLMLTLLGTMTLWSGLMEVLLRTGDVAKLGLLIRKLFGRHSRALPDTDCWEAVGMNLAANILGLECRHAAGCVRSEAIGGARRAGTARAGAVAGAQQFRPAGAADDGADASSGGRRTASGGHLGRYADFVRRRDGSRGHSAGRVRQNPPKRSESAWRKPPPSPSS